MSLQLLREVCAVCIGKIDIREDYNLQSSFNQFFDFPFQIILTSCMILVAYAQTDAHPYQTVDNACSKCECIDKQDTQPSKFYVLDCISRNFNQILPEYPSFFDLSDKGDARPEFQSLNVFNVLFFN